MASFAKFGNDLYTGARSVDFVGRRRVWYMIAIVMVLASIAIPFVRGGGDFSKGFNFGIDFTGGSQFQISDANSTDTIKGRDAALGVVPSANVLVTTAGNHGVQVQTNQLTDQQSQQVATALAHTYGVAEKNVTNSFIGATWGADVTGNALRALIVFVIFAAVLMALYFRTWKMSAAAILSLLHDLVITAGVYAATGFTITPATIIGFLTILGYSLYDVVVVFDKIRENTAELTDDSTRTFGEAVNLAVNQTLVRSINTGVVAALPVAAILFIGSFILGADTLKEISLALFVGTVVSTYSTPFVASPLYAQFRSGEAAIRQRDEKARRLKARAAGA
ncbi:protein translocase subunit SecF [Pseudolysinimonas kribbensis]|uniref:Protein-export membrane protein SecF n=1 Tax=Pseudolysinimonas kribbensis TaxID=433641 RepID=A0ABQ6KEB5_9MICO|nr:protein translocase subunit SecF [Pseudolysinimonas kribbensis]GMA96979.1 protein-export membrane protein SecF [Pseudolysinimonas kribbensis]